MTFSKSGKISAYCAYAVIVLPVSKYFLLENQKRFLAKHNNKKQKVHMHRDHMSMYLSKLFLMRVSLTSPRCRRMSVSALADVKDVVVFHPLHSGMTRFVTAGMDSISPGETCTTVIFERLSLCFTLTTSHTWTRANAVVELTTKACLSNCEERRLGHKETHNTNVSISCTSESFCLCNTGKKHGFTFELLSCE